jgi:hypothetical protein
MKNALQQTALKENKLKHKTKCSFKITRGQLEAFIHTGGVESGNV